MEWTFLVWRERVIYFFFGFSWGGMIVVAVFFFQLPSSIKTTFSPIPMINQQRAFYLRHLNYGHLFVPTLFIFPCDSLRVTSGHFRMYQKSRRKIKVKIITHSPTSSHLNRVPPDNNGHVDLRHHHSSLFACKIINKWKLTTLCGGEKRVTSFRPSVLWDCAKIIITCIRRNDLRSPLHSWEVARSARMSTTCVMKAKAEPSLKKSYLSIDLDKKCHRRRRRRRNWTTRRVVLNNWPTLGHNDTFPEVPL